MNYLDRWASAFSFSLPPRYNPLRSLWIFYINPVYAPHLSQKHLLYFQFGLFWLYSDFLNQSFIRRMDRWRNALMVSCKAPPIFISWDYHGLELCFFAPWLFCHVILDFSWIVSFGFSWRAYFLILRQDFITIFYQVTTSCRHIELYLLV